jgi:hypothetical protein
MKRTVLLTTAGIVLLLCMAACQAFKVPGTGAILPAPTQPQNTPTASQTLQSNTGAIAAVPIVTGTTAPQTPEPPADHSTPTDSATLTAWPTIQFTPSLGPTPTHTPTATYTPTITSTPLPPLASLRLIRPGPLSKISSPIKVEAMVTPGDDGYVYFDLMGEDGRIINHVEVPLKNNLGQHVIITPKIDFQTNAVAETARLVMYTRDLAGRMITITSVDLFLLSLGNSEVTAPTFQQEPYLVRFPRHDDIISGGVLHLIGLAKPLSNKPLVVELIDDQQKVIGSAQIQVAPPTGKLSHTPFEIDIPYSLQEEKTVRLSLRQESDNRIPGDIALYSMLLDLQP